MDLVDVNVLVYAHREDTHDHPRFRDWLRERIDSEAAFGLAEIVLSGFVRIVTHPKVFVQTTPLDLALRFVEGLRSRPSCVLVAPRERHWEIFTRLCTQSGAKGNPVVGAYLAALAMESGSMRFPGLRWRHPLEAA